MFTYSELDNWLDALGRIIYDTNVSITIIQRLRQPNDKIEKMIINDSFFSYLYRQLRFTVIVQLCKVLDENDNQKRSLIRLFNKLNFDKYDDEIKKLLKSNSVHFNQFTNKAEILNTIELLRAEIERHQELIVRVVTNRNKLYAHSDPDPGVPLVSDDELEELIKLSNKIFNEVYFKFFYCTYAFEHTRKWEVDNVLKLLVKYKKEEMERHK